MLFDIIGTLLLVYNCPVSMCCTYGRGTYEF